MFNVTLKIMLFASLVLFAAILSFPSIVLAHGDVTPQEVDTTGLEPLGEEWLDVNPYKGNELAVVIGKRAYDMNCARCHGIDGMTGGFSPDLRLLPNDEEGDAFFIYPTREGVFRNGNTYMPAYEGLISQDAMWAIRTWLETKHVEE